MQPALTLIREDLNRRLSPLVSAPFFMKRAKAREMLLVTDLPLRASGVGQEAQGLLGDGYTAKTEGGLMQIGLSPSGLRRFLPDPLDEALEQLSFPAQQTLEPAYQLLRLLISHPLGDEAPSPLHYDYLKSEELGMAALQTAIPRIAEQCALLLRLGKPLPARLIPRLYLIQRSDTL